MQRTIGQRTFDFSRRVAVMAIVNRTPDSFSDPGVNFKFDAAIGAVERALAAGADWIDIGGVRAGPGPHVSEEEELRRVLPLVEATRQRTDAVISVETWRPGVAYRVLQAGADAINDPFGLHDPALAEVAAEAGAALVLTHYGQAPRTPLGQPVYQDVVAEVVTFLRERAAMAIERAVGPDRLIVDPGLDFHKTTAHSLELLRRLSEIKQLGYPVLVAISNKDFIGETLDLPVDQRLEGTLAAIVVAIFNGANIVRVHNVEAAVRAVRMTEAVLGWRPPAKPRFTDLWVVPANSVRPDL